MSGHTLISGLRDSLCQPQPREPFLMKHADTTYTNTQATGICPTACDTYLFRHRYRLLKFH
jgi:hypothetical protein